MPDWIRDIVRFFIDRSLKLYVKIVVGTSILLALILADISFNISDFYFTNAKINTIRNAASLSNEKSLDAFTHSTISKEIHQIALKEHPYRRFSRASPFTGVNAETAFYKYLFLILSSVGINIGLGLFFFSFEFSGLVYLRKVFTLLLFNAVLFSFINHVLPNFAHGIYGRYISNAVYQIMFLLLWGMIVVVWYIYLLDKATKSAHE